MFNKNRMYKNYNKILTKQINFVTIYLNKSYGHKT